ncbi:MAG: VWA domain-containing protein, partial [Gammaproteobacteria bacterium]
MITLTTPWLLLLLPLPWFVYRYLPPVQIGAQQGLRVPFLGRLTALPLTERTHPNYRPNSLFTLLIMTWVLLILAAARPAWVGEPVALTATGRDLMLAVDVSESMQLHDFVYLKRRIDRLTAVKVVLSEFIKQRRNDRLGLILFGTQAYIQAPLTRDRQTIIDLLQESAIGIAGNRTAIGDAIGLTLKRLNTEKANNRVLILLTDGSNTAGELSPEQAAKLAQEAKLKIYTIGLGGPTRSGVDETTLRHIADTTGGQYFLAQDLNGLNAIYDQLDQLETSELAAQVVRPRKSLAHLPLCA